MTRRRGSRRLESALRVLEAYPELRPAALRAARRYERAAAVQEAELLLGQVAAARIFRNERGYEIRDWELPAACAPGMRVIGGLAW